MYANECLPYVNTQTDKRLYLLFTYNSDMQSKYKQIVSFLKAVTLPNLFNALRNFHFWRADSIPLGFDV